MMELQALRYPPCLGRIERLVQRTELVNVEVVQNNPDLSDIRVRLIYQISCAVSLALVVITLYPARCSAYGGTAVSHQLVFCQRASYCKFTLHYVR